MKWFDNQIKNVNELRTVYKRLLIKWHPDNNKEDTTLVVQEINAEYDELFKRLKYSFENDDSYSSASDSMKQAYDYSKDQGMRDIIQKLCIYEQCGVILEICGTWLWVSGNTKEFKEEFKTMGLHWAKKKKMWYIHFDDYRKYSKRTMSMDHIRETYGSVSIHRKEENDNRRLVSV